MDTHFFTKKEEIFHAITHGIGAVLSIAALVLLIIFASFNGDPALIVSVIIFGVSMLFMYTSSTLVHSLPIGKWKSIFLIIDHASIYVFIAGTYTPFLLVVLSGKVGWILFGIIWGIALTGIVLKVFFVKRFIILSTVAYIVMGWLITTVWNSLVEGIHENGLILLVAGGIVYTVGAVFYVWKQIPYHHVIWHIFVLVGSICHFFAVLFYVI